MGDETGCLYVARDWLLYVSERQSYSGLKNNAPALSISPRGTWTVTHGSSETTGRVFLHPPQCRTLWSRVWSHCAVAPALHTFIDGALCGNEE